MRTYGANLALLAAPPQASPARQASPPRTDMGQQTGSWAGNSFQTPTASSQGAGDRVNASMQPLASCARPIRPVLPTRARAAPVIERGSECRRHVEQRNQRQDKRPKTAAAIES